MKIVFRLFFLCLVAFSPFIFADSVEQPWLKCSPTDRFAPLTQLSLRTLVGYEDQFVPYLQARGVNDEISMETFFYKDLFHIAQALSILFEQDSTTVLHNLLGDSFSLIEGYNTQIDHVGRELFGPISFYLPLLDQIAPQLGLKKLKHLVFPSTQVVKVLQEHDPSVRGVTIGRVYFQSEDTGSLKCVELFQASPQDGKFPQNILATQERISLLTSCKGNSELYRNNLKNREFDKKAPQNFCSERATIAERQGASENENSEVKPTQSKTDSSSCFGIIPIDHLSIELNTVEEVQHIHNRIHQLASETLMPYQKEISHNPGDGSTQTKTVIRDSIDTPFNKIVEFVHYVNPS